MGFFYDYQYRVSMFDTSYLPGDLLNISISMTQDDTYNYTGQEAFYVYSIGAIYATGGDVWGGSPLYSSVSVNNNSYYWANNGTANGNGSSNGNGTSNGTTGNRTNGNGSSNGTTGNGSNGNGSA